MRISSRRSKAPHPLSRRIGTLFFILSLVVLDFVWINILPGQTHYYAETKIPSSKDSVMLLQPQQLQLQPQIQLEQYDDHHDDFFLLTGHWVNDTNQSKPYKLPHTAFLPKWNESRNFWAGGRCRNESNHQLRWIPTGSRNNDNNKTDTDDDTDHDEKYEIDMDLTLDQWKFDFCHKYKGKHFMFVGDSIMGQTFTSFVHLLGGIHESQLTYNITHHHHIMIHDLQSLYEVEFIRNPKRRSKELKKFRKMCGSCVTEIAITTRTCAAATAAAVRGAATSTLSDMMYDNGQNDAAHDHDNDDRKENDIIANTVRATFFRNDFLSLNGISATSTDIQPLAKRTKWGVDCALAWVPFVKSTDFLVLNTGRHYRPIHEYINSLNTTFTWLENSHENIENEDNKNSTSSSKGTRKDSNLVKFFISSKLESYGRTVYKQTRERQKKTVQPYKSDNSNSNNNNLCYTTSNHTANGKEVPLKLEEIEIENSLVKRLIQKRFPSMHYLDFTCLDLQMDVGLKDYVHSCMPGPIDYRSYILIQKLLRM